MDLDFVRQCQRGDPAALAKLVDQVQGPLMGYLCRMTGDRVRAKDALQDTMLRALRALPDWKPSGSFEGWLFTIARNCAMALLPLGGAGLVGFLLLYCAARLLWAGVDTVRSVMWSVNYPRHLRARITGRILVNGSLALASSGLLLGWLLEREGPWFRAALAAAAVCGVGGAVAFRRLRVRREQQLLEAERARMEGGARFDLAGIRDLLASDAVFRHYMFAMSLFGAGLLSLTPLMVVCLDDVLRVSETMQVAVTTAVPVLVMPFAIQPWARFLDRHHVIVFRSVHGWIAVGAAALLGTAVLARVPLLLWPGAVMLGVSFAAGSLGWSLGHNDFAPRGEETRYMALHVTLTGLRGLIALDLGRLRAGPRRRVLFHAGHDRIRRCAAGAHHQLVDHAHHVVHQGHRLLHRNGLFLRPHAAHERDQPALAEHPDAGVVEAAIQTQVLHRARDDLPVVEIRVREAAAARQVAAGAVLGADVRERGHLLPRDARLTRRRAIREARCHALERVVEPVPALLGLRPQVGASKQEDKHYSHVCPHPNPPPEGEGMNPVTRS